MSKLFCIYLVLLNFDVVHAVPTPAMLKSIRNFRVGNLRIQPAGGCERLLAEASDLLERPLTYNEISENLHAILDQVGEMLIPTRTAPATVHLDDPRPDSPRCRSFGGRMTVMTRGLMTRVQDLRPGQTVYSFDLETRRRVDNNIREITASPNQTCGRLPGLSVPIEVTSGNKFYGGDGATAPDFKLIGSLTPDDWLFEFSWRATTPLNSVRRLSYETMPRPITVYEISLAHTPHNFFVEGILVHDCTE